jgi:leucyl/phenylalanyl-tRNA---protein transferase
MHFLTQELIFPDPETADEEGLLAAGGDLSVQRLLVAYRNGIFPWYTEPFIGWYSPDPRFVLFPAKLKVSKSMKTLLNTKRFRFTVNKAFSQVIRNCKIANRKGQPGSWISEDMIKAYIEMHKAGYAVSVEAWDGNNLAGGLYGLRLGNIFFGESMFSNISNASKYAFIKYVQILAKDGVQLIDCQVYTEHLESMGAEEIPRKDFLEILKENISSENLP